MEKRELKIQLIIDTAFKVWGANYFYNTSLSSLAGALGMTKSGLYRYFKNKDALIMAMENDFIGNYRGSLKKSSFKENRDLDSLLVDYTENTVRFFAENYQYYRFFVLKLINKKQDMKQLFNKLMYKGEYCLGMSIMMELGFSQTDAQSISGFVLAVGGFFLNRRLFSETVFTKKEIEQMLKSIRVIVRYGFHGHDNRMSHIDYELIEKKSVIGKNDVLAYNKIFSAIAEVIADKGIWNTTVDSIASHLEMGKSSLYFYFDNKEQMMKDVVGNEKEHLNKLIIERITQFESFEEQLYCILYIMSSYFYLKPSIFAIMNWLRYQLLNTTQKFMDKKIERVCELIHAMTMTSSFNPLGFSPDLIAQGISFILIHGLRECIYTNRSQDIMKFRIRKIHKLFLYGLRRSI